MVFQQKIKYLSIYLWCCDIYLQFIASAVSHIPSPTLTPSYLPSKFTFQQVTEKLGIDFNAYKQEYMWALTESQLKQSAQKPSV
ncbi:hypothetical protein I7I48_01761 [Histoplasma ohiense]|nr:hypothetical protein I7I48_01761 [Histoplasma ohiense (nom. inval.)]